MTGALPMPRRPAGNGPRAFEAMPAVPDGCFTVNVDGRQHWPHLCPGEVAIVDARIREIEWGELYAVRQSRGPNLWQICKEPRSDVASQFKRPIAWMRPLNNQPPRYLRDGRLDPSCEMHLSEGPIYLDALEGLILGRVIGVLDETPYDPAVGRKQPVPSLTIPHVRPEDELKWRYLAWLTMERNFLSVELGARSRLGIYSLEDRIANLAFDPGVQQLPGRRAETVLAAAGVSVEPDPHWVGHIL